MQAERPQQDRNLNFSTKNEVDPAFMKTHRATEEEERLTTAQIGGSGPVLQGQLQTRGDLQKPQIHHGHPKGLVQENSVNVHSSSSLAETTI